MRLQMRLERRTGSDQVNLEPRQLVIAGWAARDMDAMERHIAELEAVGVARPSATPTFYRVSTSRLTHEPEIEIPGETASGEAETVIFAQDGELYVGLGSDHTDRKLEAYSVTASKQVCDKPLSSIVWPFDEIAGHWDELVMRSWMSMDGQRQLYQEGAIAELLRPEQLITKCTGGADTLPEGTALFGGTLPAIGGMRHGLDFSCELEDPVLKRKIELAYTVISLPVAG